MAITYTAAQLNARASSHPSSIRTYSAEEWLEWASKSSNNWAALSAGVVKLISADRLNGMAGAGGAGTSNSLGRMTTAQFKGWVDAGASDPSPHAFTQLSANAITALASSAGRPLLATNLTPALVNAWFYTLPIAAYLSLSAGVFNELAASPNSLLSNLTMSSAAFSQWIAQDPTRFYSLSARTLNALSVTRTVQGERDRPLMASAISDTVWARWMSEHTSTGNNFNALDARTIDTLAWSGPTGALRGMGSFMPLRNWIEADGRTVSSTRARIRSLGVIAINTISKLGGQEGFQLESVYASWSHTWLYGWRLSNGAGAMGAVDAAFLNYAGNASMFEAADWLAWVGQQAVGSSGLNNTTQLREGAWAAISADTLNVIGQANSQASRSFLGGVQAAQFSAWINTQGMDSATALRAATLNELALSPNQPLSEARLSTAWMTGWLSLHTSSTSHFRLLSANTLNALSQGPGQPLLAATINAALFGQWLSANTSGDSQFFRLSASTLNQLMGGGKPPEIATQVNPGAWIQWATEVRLGFSGDGLDFSAVCGTVLSQILSAGARPLTAAEWQRWLNGTPSGLSQANRGQDLAWFTPRDHLLPALLNQIAADTTRPRNLVGELTADQFANWCERYPVLSLHPITLNRLGSGLGSNGLQATHVTAAALGSWLAEWGAEGFAALNAQTLHALATNNNGLYATAAMTAGLLDTWLSANAGSEASALSLATLNAWAEHCPNVLSQSSQFTVAVLGNWITAQDANTTSAPRGFAALSIAALNALSLSPGQALREQKITGAVWGDWLSSHGHSLAGLSVQVINELAEGGGAPLLSGAMTQAMFGTWLSGVTDQQLRQLTPLAVQTLATHPNALLSTTALTQARFNAWLDTDLRALSASTLSALNANPNQLLRASQLNTTVFDVWLQVHGASFSQLSAGVLNQLGANASRPLAASRLTPERWAAWLDANPSGTGGLRDLTAATLNALALSGPSGALGGMGAQHLEAWLNASTSSGIQTRLNSLSAAAINSLTEALTDASSSNSNPLLTAWTGPSQMLAWFNHRRASAGEGVGAFSARTLARIQGLVTLLSPEDWVAWGLSIPAGQTTQNRFGDLPAAVVASFSATALNDIVRLTPAGYFPMLVDLTKDQWSAWLDGAGATGFQHLSASALKVIAAASIGSHLREVPLSQSQWASWMTRNAAVFRELGAHILNALGANTGQPLRIAAVDRNAFNLWLGFSGNQLAHLGAATLNSLHLSAAVNKPLSAALLTPEAWQAWLVANVAEQPGLDPGLFAALVRDTHFSALATNDRLGAITAAQMDAWLSRSDNQFQRMSAIALDALARHAPNALRASGLDAYQWTIWIDGQGGSGINALSADVLNAIPVTYWCSRNPWGLIQNWANQPGHGMAQLEPSTVACFSPAAMRETSANVRRQISGWQWSAWSQVTGHSLADLGLAAGDIGAIGLNNLASFGLAELTNVQWDAIWNNTTAFGLQNQLDQLDAASINRWPTQARSRFIEAHLSTWLNSEKHDLSQLSEAVFASIPAGILLSLMGQKNGRSCVVLPGQWEAFVQTQGLSGFSASDLNAIAREWSVTTLARTDAAAWLTWYGSGTNPQRQVGQLAYFGESFSTQLLHALVNLPGGANFVTQISSAQWSQWLAHHPMGDLSLSVLRAIPTSILFDPTVFGSLQWTSWCSEPGRSLALLNIMRLTAISAAEGTLIQQMPLNWIQRLTAAAADGDERSPLSSMSWSEWEHWAAPVGNRWRDISVATINVMGSSAGSLTVQPDGALGSAEWREWMAGTEGGVQRRHLLSADVLRASPTLTNTMSTADWVTWSTQPGNNLSALGTDFMDRISLDQANPTQTTPALLEAAPAEQYSDAQWLRWLLRPHGSLTMGALASATIYSRIPLATLMDPQVANLNHWRTWSAARRGLGDNSSSYLGDMNGHMLHAAAMSTWTTDSGARESLLTVLFTQGTSQDRASLLGLLTGSGISTSPAPSGAAAVGAMRFSELSSDTLNALFLATEAVQVTPYIPVNHWQAWSGRQTLQDLSPTLFAAWLHSEQINGLSADAAASVTAEQWATWAWQPGHQIGSLTDQALTVMDADALRRLPVTQWQFLLNSWAPARQARLSPDALRAMGALGLAINAEASALWISQHPSSDDIDRLLLAAIHPSAAQTWLNAAEGGLTVDQLAAFNSVHWAIWLDAHPNVHAGNISSAVLAAMAGTGAGAVLTQLSQRWEYQFPHYSVRDIFNLPAAVLDREGERLLVNRSAALADYAPLLRIEIVNQLSANTLARLLPNDSAWKIWGAALAATEPTYWRRLSARVLSAHASAVGLMTSAAGGNAWSIWSQQPENHLQQLSIDLINQIPLALGLAWGSPQWAELIQREGTDGLRRLQPTRFAAELTASVLDDWPEQWIAEVTIEQWRTWTQSRPQGLAQLSPSTLSALPSEVIAQMGAPSGWLTSNPLQALAARGRLDELSGQFLARLGIDALNGLTPHINQFTQAQWLALQLSLSTRDTSGLQTPWRTQLGGPQGSEIQNLFLAAHDATPLGGISRTVLLNWALELAQGPDCARFLKEYTDLLRATPNHAQATLLVMLQQAPDAGAAGALVTVLRMLPMAYSGLPLGQLLAGVLSPASSFELDRFIDVLVPNVGEAALRGKLRASLVAFLDDGHTPYERLSWLGGHLMLLAADHHLLDGLPSSALMNNRRQVAQELSDILEVFNQGGDVRNLGALEAIGFANAMASATQGTLKAGDLMSWSQWAAFGKTGVLLAAQFSLSRMNNLMRDHNLRQRFSGVTTGSHVIPASGHETNPSLEDPLMRMAAASEALTDIISVNRLLILLAQTSQAQASFESGAFVTGTGQALQALGSITNILAAINQKADALRPPPVGDSPRAGLLEATWQGALQLLGNAFSPVSWAASLLASKNPTDPSASRWFASYSPYVTKVIQKFSKPKGGDYTLALRTVNTITHRLGSIMVLSQLINDVDGTEDSDVVNVASLAIAMHSMVGMADLVDAYSTSTERWRVYGLGSLGLLGNLVTLGTNTYLSTRNIEDRRARAEITDSQAADLTQQVLATAGWGVGMTVLIPTALSRIAPWGLRASGSTGARLFNSVRAISGVVNTLTLATAVVTVLAGVLGKSSSDSPASPSDPDALRAALHLARANGCLVDAALIEAALGYSAPPSDLNLRQGALQRLQAFQQNSDQVAQVRAIWAARGPDNSGDFQWLAITQFAAQFQSPSESVQRVSGAAQFTMDANTGFLSLQANPGDQADMDNSSTEGVAWGGVANPALGGISPGDVTGSVYIRPVLETNSLQAFISVVDSGTDQGSWNSAAGDPRWLFIDARGLPDGSFVCVDPSLTNVKVIYEGGQTLTTSIHAQLVRDPNGAPGPAHITLSGLDLSGRGNAGLTIDADALWINEDMALYGSQHNDVLVGKQDGLTYHYGGGRDRVNYGGSHGTISLGLASTARLTGSNNVMQMVAEDAATSSAPGRWVSIGESNVLDFSSNAGGLRFSLRAGHGEVQRTDSPWWSGQAANVTVATFRGFAVLRGTMGSDTFTISESATNMRGEATPMSWFGGSGNDQYTVSNSDGHQLSLGLGNNTVVLDAAVGTVVATARAEAGRATGYNTITLRNGATLEAVLMGNTHITSDRSGSWDWNDADTWVRAKVSGGTHTIDLEGQTSLISIDARRSSTTTVDNLINGQDRASQLQQVLLGSNANFTLLAGLIDADSMELVSVNASQQVVARLRLDGNLDADMLLMWGLVDDDEGVDSTDQMRAYRADHLISAMATAPGTTSGSSGAAHIAASRNWTRYVDLGTLTTPPPV